MAVRQNFDPQNKFRSTTEKSTLNQSQLTYWSMAKSSNSRFSSIQTDPRFQLPRKRSIRGEVDSRFKDALNSDDRFTEHAKIDKYGRKIKGKDAKKELSRYYNFDEEKEIESERSASPDIRDLSKEQQAEFDIESEESEPTKASSSSRSKPNIRELMRGEGALDSSSDDSSDLESDDSEESDEDSEPEFHAATKDEYETIRAEAKSIPEGDESHRLAVVNLDWDNVTAVDLMATFSSFVPKTRRIVSVKVYPSEFGKKQMALEEINGPAQELFPEASKKGAQKNKTPEPELDDDQDYSSSKLRSYQLQRLQYYYAVVDCDSIETAANIYTSCDGTEFESTANFFDLRFIPDEVDFSQDKPRDECFKLPLNYQPTSFTTDALQHSKVKLTWDETPKERSRIAQKAFSQKDIENEDLKAYLASESDSDEDEESIASRYRALLGRDVPKTGNGIDNDSNDDGDAVEITFNPVLDGKQAQLEVVGNGSHDNKELEENLSTIEKYKLKEKQRRLRRQENYKARKAAEAEEGKGRGTDKAELELLAMDDEYELNSAQPAVQEKKKLTKRAAKKKAQEDAEQDFDTADPRFQALYEDPDFAIDSTLPQYKKTKGMKRIIDERRKRQDSEIQNENTRFGKFKRKQLETSQHDSDESIKHLASKLRRKNRD